MATTDAKPGFRLPWSADRGDAATSVDSAATVPTGSADAQVDPTPDHEVDTPAMIDAPATEAPTSSDATPAGATADAPNVAPATAPTPAAALAPARKPNKLMADLTRAMQAAAEQARTEALTRLGSDSKAFIETIHAASATEATELRRRADDDVAAIREWSKAEIARIREETEERISGRKGHLEREIEKHAAAIERRIERVQARVTAFETEMAGFFERLTAEEDPTRLAAMAESLPEPPSFDAEMDWEDVPVPTDVVEPVAAPVVEIEAAPVVEVGAAAEVEAVAEVEIIAQTEAIAETADTPDATVTAWPTEGTSPWGAAPALEPNDAAGRDLFSIGSDDAQGDGEAAGARLAALGFEADFAAAEAEAASFGDADSLPDDDIPVIGDDALAARLASLVPDAETAGQTRTTRVVVVGLVSVASIAGFKRHLSRVPGVESVGVSSGPDGEFVFAVVCGLDLDLHDAIATLPGFGARVSSETDGDLHVTARDPENG